MKSAPEKIAEKKAPLDAKRGKRGGARPGAGRPKGTTGIPSPGSGRGRPKGTTGIPSPGSGRKKGSFSVEGGASVSFTFRISKDIEKRLKFIAKLENKTPANFLRDFINSKYEELQEY